MKQDIRLYLSGQLVDFKEDPKILFTYKVTDTQSPAAVKNSFSKSITIEGTDNNNAIFGEMYDLSRMQTYGAGTFAGSDFNPLKKADFQLFIDGELYETGYFKLTDITKTRGNITYSVQLFGGLGEFLFNLQEAQNGNKLEFKDLMLVKEKDDVSPMDDLGFTISKDTVASAWDNVQTSSSKYSTLNFVPAYNGLPSDFDADKCIINLYQHSYNLNNVTGISSYDNWAKGECSREMTEWETRDLRSYMMRPALRVKTLLQTIANKTNNGGYEVELDSKFFNHNNPYYEDAWITLGMIKDIIASDSESESTEITGATITEGSGDFYDITTSADFSDYSNLDMTLRIGMDPYNATPSESRLYLCTDKKVKGAASLSNEYVKSYYKYYSAVILQLVGFNELGEPVAVSNAYQLSTEVPGVDVDFTDMLANIGIPVPEWTKLWGWFAKTGSTYEWVDRNGNPQQIRFRFPSSTKFHTLKLRIQRPYYREFRKTGFAGQKHIKERYADGSGYLWKMVNETVQGNHTPSWYGSEGAVICHENLSLDSFFVTSTRYGGFLSGKYISQDKILTLGITPADFLLSYIKLFGLHIWKDPIERKIFIADRSVYYDRNDIVDINELVDRSKAIKVTPQVAQAKWYDFNTEQNDNEANEQYKDNYGMEFGLQRVNTSYGFDSSTISVYDGEFKGAVQVLEKSGYYYGDFDLWPVYCYNGFTLSTYRKNEQNILEGTDYVVNPVGEVAIYPMNEHDGFDLFDKPQFHTADNDAAEGALTLLFFTENIANPAITPGGGITYRLSDDLEQMVSLNDKTPCWIITDSEYDSRGNHIAVTPATLPHFSRYLTYSENNYITHSWDFGRTLETYIPDTVLTSGSSIYERCWGDYIADMYDVDSRLVSCYCKINGRANPEWLRRFYWWDNAIWRLNTIKEWNPGSYATTLCEFLKVKDVNDYNVNKITKNPVTDFYLPDYVPTSIEERKKYYTIPSNVTAVTVNVEVQDGGVWYYGDGPGADYMVEYEGGNTYYYPYTSITASHTDSGRGNKSDVFEIGSNVAGVPRIFRFNIVIYGASGDEFYYIYLRQEPTDAGGITISRFGGWGNVPAAGGQVLLKVESDSAWTANLDYNYTSLDRYYAQAGITNIVMTVEPNDSSSSRMCRVVATTVGGSSYTYQIEQNGAGVISNLDFHVSDTVFDAEGGSKSGYVACPEADGSWAVTSCPAWLSVSPSTGDSGTTQIVVTAQANTGGERFGVVTITAGVDTDTINFGQRSGEQFEGIEITLDKYDFAGTGETVNGEIRSSVDGWHFEYPYWAVPSVLSGNSGTTQFTVTVEPNYGRYGRVGTFAAQGGGYRDEAGVTQNIYGQ